MHPNPIFHSRTQQANLAFAHERGFGVLAVNGPEAPLLAHVPFILDGATVWLHLMRSNPVARLGTPVPACIAVSGPDSYISPDWYDLPDQVPTWNYVAVHLKGNLRQCPDADLRGVLDRLSARFEARLAPKPPWHSDKMTAGVMERMMRAVLPFRMDVESVDGTWKLNQNKPEAARLNAAKRVESEGVGNEILALARLMRDVEP